MQQKSKVNFHHGFYSDLNKDKMPDFIRHWRVFVVVNILFGAFNLLGVRQVHFF